VFVNGNQLGGQYWGRGVSVVGGQSITISRNTFDNVPLAAAIFLAREANWQTFGVGDVLIDSNYIHDVQTRSPPYDYQNTFASASLTGHGAIEIQTALFSDEAADPYLSVQLGVNNVLVRGNVVDRAAVSGMRAGVNLVHTYSMTLASGQLMQRSTVPGHVRNVGVTNNRFNQTTREAIRILSADASNGVYCNANQVDGNNYQTSACKSPTLPATQGAPLNCSADGKLL